MYGCFSQLLTVILHAEFFLSYLCIYLAADVYFWWFMRQYHRDWAQLMCFISGIISIPLKKKIQCQNLTLNHTFKFLAHWHKITTYPMIDGGWTAVARPIFAYMSFALWGWQLKWKGCSGCSALLGQRGISPATLQPSFLHCSQEFQLSKNHFKGPIQLMLRLALKCNKLVWTATMRI